QGTIEAQENPFALILTAGFAEVQKYVNVTDHVMSWSYVVIGERQFQALPDELKPIFLAAVEEMDAYAQTLFLESEQKARQALEERGMEFIEVDKAAFSQKCEEAIFNSLSSEMQAVYTSFLESRKN
ncbi:MAG: TRAP transporter substrate-binding protein DctP, partial [Bacteroidota bacterium]